MAPVFVLFALITVGLVTIRAVDLPAALDPIPTMDLTTRNTLARGQSPPPGDFVSPFVPALAVTFALATAAMALAVRRRDARLGVAVTLAAMAVLLLVSARGLEAFARSRSAQPIAETLARLWRPGDVVVHEGPLENSASVLVVLPEPVQVVNGLQSNLAFGATFPEARVVFRDPVQVRTEWTTGRRFLISIVSPEGSIVRDLPAGRVRLLAEAGGRRLYVNGPD
jgi:hypothetical protein